MDVIWLTRLIFDNFGFGIKMFAKKTKNFVY